MTLVETRAKKIACLETDWWSWDDRESVRPLLELIEHRHKVTYVHRRSSTREQFEADLKKVAERRSYRMIYLAYHGRTGHLAGEEWEISLDEIAGIVGTRCAGRIMHLGGCRTGGMGTGRLRSFAERTGLAVVSGYSRTVDWMRSAAFELLYLDTWQQFRDIGAVRRRVESEYGQLADALGFQMVTGSDGAS